MSMCGSVLIATDLRATALVCRSQEAERIVPLPHAHAHNDYFHKRALLDALDQGFCTVEADVFLVKGELLVAHTIFQVRAERTLESLYLMPLRERVKENGGKVFKDGPVFWLLVDVKTEANSTYQALDKMLASYGDVLSVVKDAKFHEKAITVVVSGNRATADLAAQKVRYAGIDGRAADLDSAKPAHLMPWISENWTTLFQWRGDGPMPEKEKTKLREFVRKAHNSDRLVRFWATPERVELWRELRAAGVDLINADRLAELRSFLSENSSRPKNLKRRGAQAHIGAEERRGIPVFLFVQGAALADQIAVPLPRAADCR
jgi:hypothetical protein